MHRKELLKSIQKFKKSKWCSQEEQNIADEFTLFIQSNEKCFLRELEKGHITGSCLLWNETETACLFTLHKKLGRWLQLGGHADEESDLLNVALKEAKEESGINEIAPITNEIFDLRIHSVPKRACEKAHLHYDVRYLLKVQNEVPFIVSSESIDLKWIELKDFERFGLDESILKMKKKLTAPLLHP